MVEQLAKYITNLNFQNLKACEVIMVELANRQAPFFLVDWQLQNLNFQIFGRELVCEVIMVEQLANRRASLFRGSGWETRPGLAVAFPTTSNKVRFLVFGPCLVPNKWLRCQAN